MQVFKFGGASVKDADSVRNVGQIIKHFAIDEAVIIVSAMGKTTNLIESLIRSVYRSKKFEKNNEAYKEYINFHSTVCKELGIVDLSDFFAPELAILATKYQTESYSFLYDQLIGFGELISSQILHKYLETQIKNSQWLDVRKSICTNSTFQNAEINWEKTKGNILSQNLKNKITISQGFIAADEDGNTTSLGREGSDYSAAIFAHVLEVESLTIWKDVLGFYNADPNHFPNAELYKKVSFREAIELAYYGASVVHPKTIQPLKKAKIPLYVRSFIHYNHPGTCISEDSILEPEVPSIIRKNHLFLVTLSTPDLSFIVEKQMAKIFETCNKHGVRVILWQNSATKCSLVLPDDPIKTQEFLGSIGKDFTYKYNKDICLYTLRNYNQKLIEEIYKKGDFILEERTNRTIQILIKNKDE